MANTDYRPNRPISSGLHPAVYKILIGFALWFVLGSWGFIASTGYIGLSLAVVTVFIVIAVAIPFQLWRIWHKNTTRADPENRASLGHWLTRDVETWQARLSGAAALAQILVPISSVAIAMTILAVVHHVIATNAA
jgi:hypothetical protein